ncbi:MAG: hypothetical protein ACRYE9_03840, partial [Janthinobacterium lividum]
MLKNIDEIVDSKIIAKLRTFPNHSAIWQVLEKQGKKQAFELPSGNSNILIEESESPFISVVGSLDEADVDAVIELCSTIEHPRIYCN